jgi:hypothetical protein
MKLTINPRIWNNSNEAAENVAREMRAHRKGASGYAVVYDDGVENFSRFSSKFENAVWDLCSWCIVNGGELEIFRNANYAIALRIEED